MLKMGGEARMAFPVAVSAGNNVNAWAGIHRQTENGVAEELKQIPEFSAARNSNRRAAKSAEDGGRLGTNGLESQRKTGRAEQGLEKMQVDEYNFGECR